MQGSCSGTATHDLKESSEDKPSHRKTLILPQPQEFLPELDTTALLRKQRHARSELTNPSPEKDPRGPPKYVFTPPLQTVPQQSLNKLGCRIAGTPQPGTLNKDKLKILRLTGVHLRKAYARNHCENEICQRDPDPLPTKFTGGATLPIYSVQNTSRKKPALASCFV